MCPSRDTYHFDIYCENNQSWGFASTTNLATGHIPSEIVAFKDGPAQTITSSIPARVDYGGLILFVIR